MESKLIFTAEEKSFIIEADGKKLRVSYDEFRGDHEDAMAFCKEQGGGDEAVENLRFIARHKDAINDELGKLDKVCISRGWYWTNELIWWSDGFAFSVAMDRGYVNTNSCYGISVARAISTL